MKTPIKTLLKPLSLALFVAAMLPTQNACNQTSPSSNPPTQNAHTQTSPPSNTIPATSPSPHFCKAIGGENPSWGHSLIQTSDGGYAIAGYTYSFGAGDYGDVYLVKLDKNGNACCAVSQTSHVGSGGKLGSPTPSIGSGGNLTSPIPTTSSGGTLTTLCP